MKKVVRIVVGVVFVALVIAIVVLAVRLQFMSEKKSTEVQAVSVQGVLNDIGELATAEYEFTILQATTKPNAVIWDLIEIPFTESKVLYSYSGTVKAGVRFDHIQVNVNDEQKKIVITLPEAQVLSRELDHDSLYVYDEQNNIFNQFTIEDLNASQEELLDAGEAQALEKGILDHASQNAELWIRASISSYYDLTEYEVQFVREKTGNPEGDH